MSEVNPSLAQTVMDWRVGLRMARAHALRKARLWRTMMRFDWFAFYAGESGGEQKARTRAWKFFHRAKVARELARDLRKLEYTGR